MRTWNPTARVVPRGMRRAVTLVELLVSVALTLLVILAIVRVFDLLGGNVTESRSILELSAQLRTAANQLQTDLDQLTLQPNPPADPLTAKGYFEIIEGVRSDRDNDGDFVVDTDPSADGTADVFVVKPTCDADLNGSPPAPFEVIDGQFLSDVRGVLGDTDDVWMGTIRSTGAPFRGRFQGTILESPLAEVVWWLEPLPGPQGNATELTLLRRVFLILPSAMQNFAPVATPDALRAFLASNDLSVRPQFDLATNSMRIVPNTLEDLGQRQNRFAHWPDDLSLLQGAIDTASAPAQHRDGSDVSPPTELAIHGAVE